MKAFWIRHPKTVQERRTSGRKSVVYDDGENILRCRAKRNQNLIPSEYDDIGRKDLGHRTWKRHRKNQWKPRFK